jgi:signal peptidase I
LRQDHRESSGLSPEPKELMTFDDHHRVAATHAEKCLLVGDAVRSFGTVRLRVTGSSMLPAVWPGDTLVILRRNINELRLGDMLLYCREGRLVVHRVVSRSASRGQSGIAVRGDSLSKQDDLVRPSEIFGTVSGIVRNGKYIQPSSSLKYYQRLIAVLISHSNSLARLVVFIHSICSAAWRREAL